MIEKKTRLERWIEKISREEELLESFMNGIEKLAGDDPQERFFLDDCLLKYAIARGGEGSPWDILMRQIENASENKSGKGIVITSLQFVEGELFSPPRSGELTIETVMGRLEGYSL